MILPVLNAHSVTAKVQIGYNPTVKIICPCSNTMEDWVVFLYQWIPKYLDKMIEDLKSLGRLIVFGGVGGGRCCRKETRLLSLS